MSNKLSKLTGPQIALLLKVHAKPAQIHPDYRPLKVLIEQDLVRVRSLGKWGSNPTVECSEAGTAMAQALKEENAQMGRECTCGRQWSLKHVPPCPQSGSA